MSWQSGRLLNVELRLMRVKSSGLWFVTRGNQDAQITNVS